MEVKCNQTNFQPQWKIVNENRKNGLDGARDIMKEKNPNYLARTTNSNYNERKKKQNKKNVVIILHKLNYKR